MKTFETIHYKDMNSNTEVIKLLKEVGFKEIKDINEEYGYLLEPGPNLSQRIRVYMKSEYLYINLTLSSLNLEIFKQEESTFYRHGKIKHRDWYKVKQIIYKKEAGMVDEFRNFLLLSICNDSFLDPEDDACKFKGMAIGRFSEDWHDWYI